MACRDFEEMLELLTDTDDLDKLVKFFSTLGICLLTKNVTYERAIKCNTLYKKLAQVLKSGMQTKSIIALNLISVLLYLDNEEELIKMKSLHIFAKNMIRVSGCLAAMTELFTSFMMQHDIWKALCRSISETCDGSAPNQAYCSHLVPLIYEFTNFIDECRYLPTKCTRCSKFNLLYSQEDNNGLCIQISKSKTTLSEMCIQKCKRGIMDPVSILQSLLTNHQGNVKLFHESKGMTMFDRESLQNPACLQLLNLVVENTKPEYRDEILKAQDLFRQLRYYLNKYGRNSMIGQWASVILFSHSKVVKTEIAIEEENKHIFIPKINKTLHNSIFETQDVNDTFNETEELLRNVLREAIGWQNQFDNKNKLKHKIFDGIYRNNNIQKKTVGMPYSYVNMHKPNRNEKATREEDNNFKFAVETGAKNDSSISFLLKDSPLEPSFKKARHSVWSGKNPVQEVQTSYKEPSLNQSYKAYEISTRGRNDETIIEFKPPFVSTPKGSKHSNEKTTSRTSRKTLLCSATRDHNIYYKTINNRSKFTNTIKTKKGLRNRSMSAKFLDIVNGSCTTLIKGFKSMFTTKKPSDKSDDESKNPVTTNVEENNSCVSSITNFINRRDVTVSKETRDQDWTNFTKEFSMENSHFNSCNTCNDTIVLKHKLENNVFLQQTVRRLKLGINLYGCDFKKISRTMWPREMSMTPNVLYNLYRKLIIKQ